jgi:hypothetical protein
MGRKLRSQLFVERSMTGTQLLLAIATLAVTALGAVLASPVTFEWYKRNWPGPVEPDPPPSNGGGVRHSVIKPEAESEFCQVGAVDTLHGCTMGKSRCESARFQTSPPTTEPTRCVPAPDDIWCTTMWTRSSSGELEQGIGCSLTQHGCALLLNVFQMAKERAGEPPYGELCELRRLVDVRDQEQAHLTLVDG